MSKITCQICGEQIHAVSTHLKKAHGPDSKEPMTLAEYREAYPDAPLMSKVAEEQYEIMKKKREEEKTSALVTVAEGKTPKPMHTLFGLGSDKKARLRNGDPLMIEYLENPSAPDLVPDIDPNYVFDVEILKTVLMGVTMSMPTYLYGHAGVGKSTIPEQICARTNRPMLRLQHTINTEESNIVGQWVVRRHKDEETKQIVAETAFQLGPLPLAMKNGWVYLADEFDRSCPSVLSVYQAVLEGKSLYIKEADEANRIIKPHPDFKFIATGNTNGAGDESGLYQSTLTQDAATFERFSIVLRVDYMPRDRETQIVANQARLDSEDAGEIVDFCTRVRKEFPSSVSLTLGPRVAINIGKIGLMRGSMTQGVELCYANRLPDSEKETVMQIAKRIWKD